MSLKVLQKLFVAVFIAVTALGLVSWAEGEGYLERPEWISQDARMRVFRADTPINKSIAVILVDEASLRAMNPIVGRWPWPRSVHGDVIDFISLGNPKAIIYDVLFTEDDRYGPDNDLRLAESSMASGNVIHAMQLLLDVPDEVNRELLNKPLPPEFDSRFRLDARITQEAAETYRSIAVGKPNNFNIPVGVISDSSMAVGAVDFDPDGDGIFRRTPLGRGYQNSVFPVLSIAPFTVDNRKVEIGEGKFTMGDRSLPLDETGRYQVNFCGKYFEYSMSGVLASAQKLLRGDPENLLVDPGEFKDKYVFIGSSAVGVEDLKATPLDTKTPGVYIHASILTNILNGDYLTPSPWWYATLAAALLAAAGSFAVLFTTHISFQVGVPMVLWLGYTAATFLAFRAFQIWPLTVPTLALWLSTLTAFVYYGVTEGRARRKVRKMFSLYVSPEVLDEVVESIGDGDNLSAGTTERVSILFSDIRSFTNISEKLSANRVVEMLNIYFTEMVEGIFKYGGTVDKFIGDAIMCFWGAPIKKPDHELSALKCALEMMDGLEKVNLELVRRGFDPIAIGVGINTGEVVLGNIGSEKKLNYTVIGDSVNLASRLEGVTKTYGAPIIISEFTYEGLNGAIPCAVVDVVAVKGKVEPIKLYRPLVGVAPSPEEMAGGRELEEKIRHAFDHYLGRRWAEALSLYNECPPHKSTDEIIRRCLLYQKEEPPAEWNGVLVMKTK